MIEVLQLFLFESLLLVCAYLLASLFLDELKLTMGIVISYVLLFQLFFYFQILQIPITLQNALCVIVPLLAILIGIHKKLKIKTFTRPCFEIKENRLEVYVLLAFFTILAYRLFQYPVTGSDTVFRWDFLGRQIFNQQHFTYYPAFDSADYHFYFWTESIPPLVSFKYLWSYLSAGSINPRYTFINVLMQFFAIASFLFAAVKLKFGEKLAWQSILLLLSCGVLVSATGINQETGLTTLCVCGLLFYSQKAELKYGDIIAMALCASLGALCREYGGIFVLIASVLLIKRISLRQYLVFLAIIFTLSAPWYIYVWIKCNNPFYSIKIGELFNYNPVHNSIMDVYKDKFYATWQSALLVTIKTKYFLFISPFLLSIAILIRFNKSYWRMYCAIAILFGLWLISIPKTASMAFSTRLLTTLCPFIVFMIICYYKKYFSRAFIITISFLAILNAAIFPFKFSQITKPEFWNTYTIIPNEVNAMDKIYYEFRDYSMTILSDDAYAYAASNKYKNITVVPVWRPDLQFIFDQDLSLIEIYSKLKKKGIHYIQFYPWSTNAAFLVKSKLYKDMKQWRLLAKGTVFQLYDISKKLPE
ncbi:MAG: hypothetical protein HRT89_14190 [Lentisphaeria bacterium]|nr:hypothetical protein [Lentisphaeria bacterium]NQZ69206.1 hypothetical protein [Lentisphaeria bacterium]